MSDRPKVLVADDSRIMRGALVRILDSAFEVIEAENVEAAWSHLAKDRTLRTLIVPFAQSGFDGQALLGRLRASGVDHLVDLPVLVITEEEAGESTHERARQAGATAILARPLTAQELITKVSVLASPTSPVDDTVDEADEQCNPSMLDELTGLFNLAYFESRGDKDLSFAQRHGEAMSVILVQVDNFPFKVRQHGRRIADQLLRKLGHYVLAVVRNEDTVARTGPHEFGVIAPMTSEAGVQVMAERILSKVRETVFDYGEKQVSFTVSMGLTTADVGSYKSFISLVKAAKANMESAVREGGNRLVYSRARGTGQWPAVADFVQAVANESASLAEKPLETVKDLDNSAQTEPLFGLDTAIAMLKQGRTEALTGHYDRLLEEVLPFMEESNRALNLGLGEFLRTLQERVKKAGEKLS